MSVLPNVEEEHAVVAGNAQIQHRNTVGKIVQIWDRRHRKRIVIRMDVQVDTVYFNSNGYLLFLIFNLNFRSMQSNSLP